MFIRVAILVLLFPLPLGWAKNNYDIVIYTVDCLTLDQKYISFLNCQLLRQRNPVVSAQLKLNETVSHFDIQCNFDLLKKDKSRMSLINIKLDGCQYLASMYKNNIFGRLLKRLRTVSTFSANCPIEKGKVFEIRNYTFNSDEYPPGPPQAKWQSRIHFLTQSKPILRVIIDGSLIYKT